MNTQKKQLDYSIISKYRNVLMGCAILGIVFCHMDVAQKHHGVDVTTIASIFHVFTAFVDVFMFLSGFGLYYSFSRKQPTYGAFLKKRVSRVLPQYLIIAFVTYGIWDLLITKSGLLSFVSDYLFISWVINGSTKYWFVLAVVIYYALFPFIYRYLFSGQKPFNRLLFFLVIFYGIIAILDTATNSYGNFRIAVERFPIFVIGTYCGKLSKEQKPISRWVPILISIIAVVSTFLQYASGTFSDWVSGFPYAYYLLRGFLGMWMAITIICVLQVIEKFSTSLSKIFNGMFGFLGGLTLEVYLFHQSWMILLDYPCTWGGYLIAAVILPIFSAVIVGLFVKGKKKNEGILNIR